VFSLGAVLAFAATGRKPFGAGTPAEVLERVVRVAADLEGAPAEVRPLIASVPWPRTRCGGPTAAELLAGVTAAQAAMAPRSESALRDPAAADGRPSPGPAPGGGGHGGDR
jgi:hypothetical protein